MTLKKLPPYAKAIDDARRQGMIPARGCMGHIAIGFEWRRNIVPDFPVVVIPPERSPTEFEWRFVAGLDIFIMHAFGDAISPTILGMVSDAGGLAISIFLAVMFLFFGGVTSIFAGRYYKKDFHPEIA